jgi:uracil-DNA glycosylase family 4
MTRRARRPRAGRPGDALAELEREVVTCRRCPRLVAWREETAAVKRSAYSFDEYWGRPLPGFGDRSARVVVLGLAPAAHGGNRTGRVFTGDRSGDWLFAALWRAGFANQPESRSRDDGLALRDCYVTAAVRCAPPANRPLPSERDNCLPYLQRELSLLSSARVIVSLGGFAWDAALRALRARGASVPRPKPRFGHGATVSIDRWTVLGCYHPSQQNTFTGRLTENMIDEVFARARELSSDMPERSLR